MARVRDELPPAKATDALSSLLVDQLRGLAVVATGEVPQGCKAELLARVAASLDGVGVRRTYESLDEIDRAAVAEAAYGGFGHFDAVRFRAKYGRDPGWGATSWRGTSSATALDLLFCGHRTLPVDVRATLRTFVREPPASEVLPAEEPAAATVIETERAAQRDLHAVLRLVETGKVAVSDKTRRPSAVAVRLIAAVLDGGDMYAGDRGAIKAFAWPLIVQAAGLASPMGSRLALTKAGVRALHEPPPSTLARAWRKWQSTTLIDELSRVEEIKGQSGRGRRGLTAVARRRAAISGALSDCPVGRWVEVDELFRHMQAGEHDFEVTRDAWRLYICEPEYGSLGYDGCGGWNILQARYALAFLLEYAATLGVIDVACVPPSGAREDYLNLWGADGLEFLSRYDGLTHIRVSPLGALCLGLTDDYSPAATEVQQSLRVLPDFEVVALDELTHADRLVLDRIAESKGERIWRLRRERLLMAVEAGESIERVCEFLQARSATGLPDTVTQLLDDLAERSGALVDRGQALLIECCDRAVATILSNDRRTGGLCLLAGEKTLAVPAVSEPAFRRAARDLGYVLGSGSGHRGAPASARLNEAA
jgi:hypothetical protein